MDNTEVPEVPKVRKPLSLARAGYMTTVAAAAGALCASVVSFGPVGASTVHGSKFTVVNSAKFGEVLADGHTVYTLKPSSTPCRTKCWKYWPPVVLPAGVKHPHAGHGVKTSKLGTRSVHGVGLQVTYEGHLLYWYYRDTAPGQVKGDLTDTWGKWSPVFLSKSHPDAGSTSGSSTAGSGGVSF